MKKTLLQILLILICGSTWAEKSIRVVRLSYDESVSRVYFFPFISVKEVIIPAVGDPRHLYCVQLSKWNGTWREAVNVIDTSRTDDDTIETLVHSVYSIEADQEKMIIYGESYSNDDYQDYLNGYILLEGKKIPMKVPQDRYFIIGHDRVYTFFEESEWKEELVKSWDIDSPSPRPISEIFEALKVQPVE